MYVWLRMFWMLMTLRSRPKVGIFDTAVCTTRAWPTDLDFNVHVNNGRVNTIADIGRMDFFIRTGLLKYAMSVGARPMVGDITSKFRQEIKAFERLTMHTRLLGVHGKWAFMEHRFMRKGRVIGNVVMRGMFKAKTGPVPPEDLMAVLGLDADHPLPTLPDWVINWHNAMEGMSAQLRAEEATLATHAH